jgi:diaminopimelate decarboxylase
VEPVLLNTPNIWDTIIFSWTWAYNASMSMKNYNSFPEAGELLLKNDWEIEEIRKRQNVEDIWRNEIEVI